MGLIQSIANIVDCAPKGRKVVTFHELILKYAMILKNNAVSGNDFISIAKILKPGYEIEYNKMMSLSEVLKLKSDCDFCQKMIDLSHDTWDRINFTRINSLPLKIYETTITQNLLFELAKFSENCEFKQVKAYEAKNEKVNGNDIEFFIQQPNGQYKFLPMQAKILYHPSNKYEKIPYKKQNQNLINYANVNTYNIKGTPLYLLYNYYPLDPSFRDFGCSIVGAKYIQNNFSKNTPTFDDLHISNNVASPWYTLICNVIDNGQNISQTDQELYDFYKSDSSSCTKDTFINQENWQEIDLLDNGDMKKDQSIIEDDFETEFLPKYRVVISNIDVEIEESNE